MPSLRLIALLALGLTACARDTPEVQAPPDLTGTWRGALTVPGGEMPFGMEVSREQDKLIVTLINGAKRSRIEAEPTADGGLTLRVPGYAHRIALRADGTQLAGEYITVGVEAAETRISLRATRDATHRFFASPLAENSQLGGRWAVEFTDSKGKKSPAVGEFQQSGANITGTFLTPTGDHGFLAGDLRGREIYLSSFDGGQALLYRGRFTDDDTIEGQVWSGMVNSKSFIARRDANANLGDAERMTQLKDVAQRFDFRFPDLDGKAVALSDARFAGKVVVVTLGGSWCPNCHDEAGFLGPLYQRYRAQGLEVIALMFEHFEDFERAAAATRRFNATHQLEYTTLIAGISNKDSAATKLPQLNGVFAYPTTLFIDRRGQVRDIHTGFAGPGTGEHYTRLTQSLEKMLQELLAEQPS